MALLGVACESYFGLERSYWIVATTLFALKDIALYPFVWQSYIPGELIQDKELYGEDYEAITDLNPHGMIRIYGELWQAQLQAGCEPQTLKKGTYVRVVERNGLLLTVRPITKADESAPN